MGEKERVLEFEVMLKGVTGWGESNKTFSNHKIKITGLQ